MLKYKSLDSFEIAGRGKIFIVENEKDRSRGNNDLLGADVMIDGGQYKVKGVEYHGWGDGIREGQKIGLLVQS